MALYRVERNQSQGVLIDRGRSIGTARVFSVEVGKATGPRGPQGLPGGATYVHTQSAAANPWVINHGLGYKPTVEVLSPGGVEVIAQVIHIDLNTVNISFPSPETGSAILK